MNDNLKNIPTFAPINNNIKKIIELYEKDFPFKLPLHGVGLDCSFRPDSRPCSVQD